MIANRVVTQAVPMNEAQLDTQYQAGYELISAVNHPNGSICHYFIYKGGVKAPRSIYSGR